MSAVIERLGGRWWPAAWLVTLGVALACACGDDDAVLDDGSKQRSPAAAAPDAASERQPPRSRVPDGGLDSRDARVEDAAAAGSGGSGAESVTAGGGASAEERPADGTPPQPVSEYCGDALRDPVLEQCDDGPGTGDDVCSPDCRVRTLPLLASAAHDDGGVANELERSLGTSPHVAIGLADGFAAVYVEKRDAASVWLQAHDETGGRLRPPIELSAGAVPVDAANPALAALPDQRYAVTFTDGGSGTPDVLLRVLDAASGELGEARRVHDSTAGFQQDPDLLWTGEELIVAWTDLLDVRYRVFDDALQPRGPARVLASSSFAIESSVTLARFGAAWAAAYRANEDGFDRIEVVAGSLSWRTPPAPPGPSGDRPALVALDDEHLLLLFTIGTSASRLQAAVLSVSSPGPVATFDFTPLREPYASDASLPQRRPSAARVGERTYVAWESTATTPESGTTAFIAELAFDRAAETLLQHEELAQPLDADGWGMERNPRLGASELFPEGALLTLWEDTSSAAAPAPRIMLDYRPSPFVDLPAKAASSTPM